MFGSKQSSLNDFSVLVYHFVVFLPCYFEANNQFKPTLNQHNPNNGLFIGHWSIANILHQYYTIIGCRYEANTNIANGNPILSQCGLTRKRQRQYRQRETNFGPIYSCCLGYLTIVAKKKEKKRKKKKKKDIY